MKMRLSDALEAIVMDGRFTVEHANGFILVWHADSGEEIAALAIKTVDELVADEPTRYVSALDVQSVLQS